MRVLSKLKKPKAIRILGGALGLLLVLSLVLMPVPALAVETMPHQFEGTVTIGTGLAPEGTIVSAKIKDIEYESGTVDAEGRYGYDSSDMFMVPADDPDTTDKEGGVSGETVEFYITNEALGLDEVKANEIAEFEIWGVTELPLTVPAVTYALTMVVEPVESGTATDVTGLSPYEEGASVSIKAEAAALYQFVNWTATAGVILAATQEETTFTMPGEAATVTANFELIPPTTFIITASAGANGTIDPVGEVEVIEGADQLFTITPATGYEILDVLVDEVSALDDLVENTYTFLDVAAIHTIAASFSIVTPPAVTIDPVTSPTNTATQTLTGTMEDGATVALTSDEATFGAVTYITTTTWSCEVTLIEGSNGVTATADTITATATIVLDTVAPTVVSKSPADGTTGVAVDTEVTATFSEAMSVPSAPVLHISPSVGGCYSWIDNVMNFTPDTALAYDTTYTVTITTDAQDLAGNSLAAPYSWSFTTAKASLGDLIDEILAAGEDTLELPAGTYSGDITIDEPITITGTEGETIISGGITIGVLIGSEVIVENLIITGYTNFGIRIVKVRAVDTFIIRNNTIQGVEGSVIGIKVDKVKAGGTLTIERNSISGNETGIKLLEAVAAGDIEGNNITGNDVGLELLAVGEHQVGARYNWWGDISGPEEENQNPGGIGDKIELADGLDYYPWLTREFQTVLDDNIAYFGFPMVQLNTGWNIISTPIALDPACATWGEYVALGNGLDVHATNPAYRFDSQTQAWVALTSDDALKPCDAIYVRMASADRAPILFSPNTSVPSKELYSGWNLVGLAWLPATEGAVYGLPANEALVTVEQVTGGFTGYKLVVSPGVNADETSWIHIAGRPIQPWTDPELPRPAGWMKPASGYWVFMLNDGTLAGFTFTPISLW